MIITDALNGRTVEETRRNEDGSITLCCDSGHVLTLAVVNGEIAVKPNPLITGAAVSLGGQAINTRHSKNHNVNTGHRMTMANAFQGYMINCAIYDENGFISFVCEPLRSNKEQYKKSSGHREIKVTHSNGLIDEYPKVSAIIALPSLSTMGDQGLF